MKHYLTIKATGSDSIIFISQEEFELYRVSYITLLNALQIEEKYEILVSNYVSFENKVLELSTNVMIREQLGYPNLFEARMALNIQLVNLLTSARLFIDQVPQNCRSCAEDKEKAIEEVKNFFAREYDANFYFRFMEALRNYTQHSSIPVHWITSGVSSIEVNEDKLLEVYIGLASNRSILEDDKQFKKKILEEMAEKVDLLLATRSYMESISRVREDVKTFIKAKVEKARNDIEAARERFALVHKGSLVGLSAYKEDGVFIEDVPIMLNWDDHRLELQKRNKQLVNLSKRFVSSKGLAYNR